MTLHTRIAVTEAVPLKELFAEARRLIGAESDALRWEDREGWAKDGSRTLGMKPDQGLPGWLWIEYRPDAPLRASDGEPYDPDDEEEGPETDPKQIRPACAFEVSLDTSYAYRGPNGEGCTELHASFIVRLAAWLQEQGSECRWQNEYNGEWAAPDDAEAFSAFLGDGERARIWFRNDVLPAIFGSLSE